MVKVDDIVRAVERRDVSALKSATPAEINAPDEGGRTPLMHAVLAEHDDPTIVKVLIELGADVNVVEGEQKWTPLHIAARDQKEAMVRALLEAGATVDPVDAFGNTPLWRSVMTSGSELGVMKELLKYGADPYRKNNFDVAPIDIARQTNCHSVVAALEGRVS